MAARGRVVGPELLWLGTAVSLLVVAGSLTPYRFDQVAGGAGIGPCLARLGLPPAGREDVLVNLLVYIPIGFALRGWIGRIAPFGAAALATCAAAWISLAVEVAQTFSSVRCASWLDVTWNTCGACIGAVIAPWAASWVERLVGRAGAAFNANPFAVAALAITIGTLVCGAAPFDFVTNDRAFEESLLSSRWWPIAERYSGAPAGAVPNTWQPILSTVGLAGVFALLAAVQALSSRRAGRDALTAVAAGAGHAALVIVLIETLQLFVRSRTFDTHDIAVNGLAAVGGAWFAIVILGGLRGWRVSRRRRKMLGRVIGLAIMVQIAFAVAWSVTPTGTLGFSFDPSNANWVPFAAVFQMPFTAALGRLVSYMLAASLLVATLALHQGLNQGRVRWSVIAAVAAIVALFCELAPSFRPSRTTDLTAPVLALMTVLVFALAHRWFRRHAVRPVPAAAGSIVSGDRSTGRRR